MKNSKREQEDRKKIIQAKKKITLKYDINEVKKKKRNHRGKFLNLEFTTKNLIIWIIALLWAYNDFKTPNLSLANDYDWTKVAPFLSEFIEYNFIYILLIVVAVNLWFKFNVGDNYVRLEDKRRGIILQATLDIPVDPNDTPASRREKVVSKAFGELVKDEWVSVLMEGTDIRYNPYNPIAIFRLKIRKKYFSASIIRQELTDFYESSEYSELVKIKEFYTQQQQEKENSHDNDIQH